MLQAGTLGAMTETGIENLAVFEALCEASAEVLPFKPHNVADTLWAMAETGIEKRAFFEALCECRPGGAALQPAQSCRHALCHDRVRHREARRLERFGPSPAKRLDCLARTRYTPYSLRRGGATALFQHTGSFSKVAERRPPMSRV